MLIGIEDAQPIRTLPVSVEDAQQIGIKQLLRRRRQKYLG
jgi:hypothetical protein